MHESGHFFQNFCNCRVFSAGMPLFLQACPHNAEHQTDQVLFLNFVKFEHFSVIRALDKREYLMIIFLFLVKTMCCDPSSELFHGDGSD